LEPLPDTLKFVDKIKAPYEAPKVPTPEIKPTPQIY